MTETASRACGDMFKRREGRPRQTNPPKEYDPLIVDAILAGQFVPGNNEHAEFAAACQILNTREGLGVSEIAERMDCSERRIYRALDTAVEAMADLDLPEFDLSEHRQEHLTDLALQIMGMATEIRNGPLKVWDEVRNLERHKLIELLMVSVAMLPIDAPARRLLQWVEEVPLIVVPQ